MQTPDYSKFGSVDHSDPTCVNRPDSGMLGTDHDMKTKYIPNYHVNLTYDNQVGFRSEWHGKRHGGKIVNVADQLMPEGHKPVAG